MALLVGVRWMVGGYLEVAEGVGRGWLRGGDEVLVTTIEEEVIAVVVFRVEVEEGRAESRSRGFIRAWTVRLRQRGVGLGRTSLDVVVRICMQERGCESVEFEEEHASEFLIPPLLPPRGLLYTHHLFLFFLHFCFLLTIHLTYPTQTRRRKSPTTILARPVREKEGGEGEEAVG